MINILKFTLLIFILPSCSLNNTGGFWSNQKKIESEKLEFETLFKEEETQTKEFNKTFNLPDDKDIRRFYRFEPRGTWHTNIKQIRCYTSKSFFTTGNKSAAGPVNTNTEY